MRKPILLVACFLACATERSPPPPPPAAPLQLQPAAVMSGPRRPDYPPSRRTDVADTVQGVRVPDPYRWLEDEKSPEVQAWMKAQDEFARAWFQKLPGRDAIARRLSELLYVDVLDAPIHRGKRWFYARRLCLSPVGSSADTCIGERCMPPPRSNPRTPPCQS